MELNYSEILKNQPIFNIGSIGHVAHGKSTLVRSITGVRTQNILTNKKEILQLILGMQMQKFLWTNLVIIIPLPVEKNL